MANQYLIVCDQQGNYIDGRYIGTDGEAYISDIVLIIQAAIWQGWDLRLTTVEPVINLEDDSPLRTWKRHINQSSPQLRTDWQGMDGQIQALKDANANLAASVAELGDKNNKLESDSEALKKDNENLVNRIIELQAPVDVFSLPK